MSLKAGRIQVDGTLTPDSMAATIERAMNDLVAPMAGDDPMGRRLFALAIARGVIKHLADNQASFHTTVRNWSFGAPTHEEPAAIDVDLGGWS
jgi:hypothetical protein